MATPAWLDQLRMASFRDVPFQVDTVDLSAGENTVLREYPFQDLPTVFSMGTAAEEIKLSAYVIGDDYLDQLARLREVLKGEGVLVHPTGGSIRCWVHGRYTVREAPAAEGGMARLDITFVRAETRRYPVGVVNTREQLVDAAGQAEDAAIEQYEANAGFGGLAGWARENILGRMRAGLDVLWNGLSVVNQAFDYYNDLVRTYYTMPLSELAMFPGVFAQRVRDLLRIPTDLETGAAWDVFSAARNFGIKPTGIVEEAYTNANTSGQFTPSSSRDQLEAAFAPTQSPYNAPSRQREQRASEALLLLIEILTACMAVRAIAQIELDNYDQALALRLDMSRLLTRLMRSTAAQGNAVATTDGLPAHQALMQLHASLLADLQARSRDLARLTTYTPESWQPAIFISYRLFGTVGWADEILSMNPHIRNPLLVPPGTALRIIKHD